MNNSNPTPTSAYHNSSPPKIRSSLPHTHIHPTFIVPFKNLCSFYHIFWKCFSYTILFLFCLVKCEVQFHHYFLFNALPNVTRKNSSLLYLCSFSTWLSFLLNEAPQARIDVISYSSTYPESIPQCLFLSLQLPVPYTAILSKPRFLIPKVSSLFCPLRSLPQLNQDQVMFNGLK